MTLDGGRWASRMTAALRRGPCAADGRRPTTLGRRARRCSSSTASRRPRRRNSSASGSRAFVAEAATVGEFLSVEHGAGPRPTSPRCSSRSAGGRRRSTRSTTCWPRWPRSPGCGTSRRSAGRRGASATSASASSGRSSCSASSRRRRSATTTRPTRTTSSAVAAARGAAGGEREPRRLPPAVPQRRRALAPALELLLRDRRQPAGLRGVPCERSPSTSPTSAGRRQAGGRRRSSPRDPTRRPTSSRRRVSSAPCRLGGRPRSPARSSTTWFATPVKPMLDAGTVAPRRRERAPAFASRTGRRTSTRGR